MFTVTDLLPGAVTGIGRATAISPKGVVVGVGPLGLGFVWTPNQQNGTIGSPIFLPTDVSPGMRPVTTGSTPKAVNAAGVVVGVCSTVDMNGAAVTRAFSLSPGGILVDLGTLNVQTGTGNFLGNSDAQGINDSGQIVGWAEDSNSVPRAFLLNPASGKPQDLLGGREPSEAKAINNAGIVVGSATFPDPAGANARQAFSAHTGTGNFASLGTLFPDPLLSGLFFGNSEANAVSNGGTIVGSSDALPPAVKLGVIFSLPNIPFGPLTSEALGASTVGSVEKVVGLFFPNPPSPATAGFVFDFNNGMLDLNTQLATPGWHIDSATGINDFGQICGVGTHSTLGGPRAVLLTP